ncbi:MAG: hypothetical protein JKY94_08180 [Rhodobacteraceae bacterium]|nr:hypothetical protein [Paracoccaceae bacterium]
MNTNALKAAIDTILVSTGTTGLAQDMTHEEIRNGNIEHAAMAQYHRWFQFYERSEGGLDNALDILAEDVTITSTLGVPMVVKLRRTRTAAANELEKLTYHKERRYQYCWGWHKCSDRQCHLSK